MSTPISKDIFDQIQLLSSQNSSISDREIARKLNIDKSTVKKWRNRTAHPGDNYGEISPISSNSTQILAENVHKWLKKHKKEVSIDAISDHFDVAIGKVRAALDHLKAQKKSIALINESRISIDTAIPPSEPSRIDISKFRGKTVRFGLTSDEHLGSKYHRDDIREALFDIWQEQGITQVYECGNMIDGEARFNKHDLIVHGMQNQVDYFIEHWPKRKGIQTHF